MSDVPSSPIAETDRAKAYRTLASAFTDDPVERWLYPESEQYRTHFPKFLAAFGGPAFDERTVWSLGGAAAVALWLPPGAEPDGDAIGAVLTETVAPDKLDDVFAVLEQMGAAHPTQPHWYLPWLGVDPSRQGMGLGGGLMAHCLEIVDRDRLPAYLETPNPRTISFYRRHGFEVTGSAQAGACPPITFMWRGAT